MLPKFVILCPVYNEEAAVPLFYQRLKPVIANLAGRYSINLVFLDNASNDSTYEEILKIKKDWSSTYIVVNSRNVGYQKSLISGLRRLSGDLFVFIDIDCEDPPELILEFVRLREAGGYEVVYGQRSSRDELGVITFLRKVFYRVLRAVADEEIILDMAEFALFTDDVRKAIVAENSSFPFIRASIGRVGFSRTSVPYKRQRRITGKTKYNLSRMVIFAVAGLLASSTLFLRLPIYLLPFWLLTLWAIGYMYVGSPDPFWLVVGALAFSAYVGAVLAFIALYVARTYKNGLGYPVSFINRQKSILPDNEA
ncbi:MAG: glycosyltransferase family 2 protein [Alphaproteobacteria bacterium]|nr:glycosyltransferase family 2 protein [Alphaproteobacteria bacterium]